MLWYGDEDNPDTELVGATHGITLGEHPPALLGQHKMNDLNDANNPRQVSRAEANGCNKELTLPEETAEAGRVTGRKLSCPQYGRVSHGRI